MCTRLVPVPVAIKLVEAMRESVEADPCPHHPDELERLDVTLWQLEMAQ